MFDDEEICNIEDCIEVFDDCVKISLPEYGILILRDRDLDYSFYNSHLLYNSGDYDRAEFCELLITYAFKQRKIKRDLYRKMGFRVF